MNDQLGIGGGGETDVVLAQAGARNTRDQCRISGSDHANEQRALVMEHGGQAPSFIARMGEANG
jgi:hypothetical protein